MILEASPIIEQVKDSLSHLTKIEMTGESETFVLFRGGHPGPGVDGFPWEKHTAELVEAKISILQGLNTVCAPNAVNYDIYVMEDTTYEKICDLLTYFDFGQDSFVNGDSGLPFNSNEIVKRSQRQEAAKRLLRHFQREPLSVLSLTSDNLLFATRVDGHKRSHFVHLGEAAWHHNNTYYPRPKSIASAQPHYSLEHFRTLGGDHGVFSLGWGDC